MSRERFSLRRVLVIAQVALSLVLVAGALLFSRSLDKLMSVDAGFREDGVLTAVAIFRQLNIPPERLQSFKDEMVERLRAIPGIESAATGSIPFRERGGSRVWMDGTDARQRQNASRSRVGPDYFKTLQITLLAGREFDTRDRIGSPPVVIVNEAFTRRFLNGASPIGKRLWLEASPGSPETQYEIIGLTRDTKYVDLREEFRPIVYDAAAQDVSGPGLPLLIRSRLAHADTVASVKKVLAEIHPDISVSFQAFKPMIEATFLRERLMATLSGLFGVLALLLASIGLYGILSYGVARRTNEIGIRMALGARKGHVFWLILREALLLVLVGIAVGLPLIFVVTRLASTLLFRLTPTDPVSMFAAAFVLLTVALVAAYLPSRRATRVDPMVALRFE